MIAAITADGYIGRDARHLADWTSKEDKKLFTTVTKEAGVIVMGSKTFATIGRALPGRRTIVYTSRPSEITAEDVEATTESPEQLVARLKAEGAAGLAVCGGASIYDLFMRAGVISEVYLTIEPLFFGSGVPLFAQSLHTNLALQEVSKLNEHTVLLRYNVLHNTQNP